MLRVIVFACFILFYFNLNAAPAVTFIEFTPIAAVPSYIDINAVISNIFILDSIMHKYGYKIIYLKASI